MLRRILLPYVLTIGFVFITGTAFAQEPTHRNELKHRISTASKTSDIAKALKEAEAGTSLGELISVRWHAHAVLTDKLAQPRPGIVTGIAANEIIAASKLYSSNAERLKSDLEKWIGQLQSSADTRPELVRAKVELGQLYEAYETQVGSRGLDDQLEKLARAQVLYADALATENHRNKEVSPDSLAIMLFLAESYMRSADFEKALPVYEDYVHGITRLDGTKSLSRLRALSAIARIVEAAGDESRHAAIKSELKAHGISLEDKLDLSLRADPKNKRGEKPVGSLHIEFANEINPSRPGGHLVSLEPKARITGTFFSSIPTVVSVDPAGDVVAIQVISDDAKIKKSVESFVRNWKFRPLVYKGVPGPMKGMVYCWIRS
jgi:hypothetical protein